MPHKTAKKGIAEDDLIVVLVGLTAGWRKRRKARAYFRHAFGERVYLPWIPYVFGLRASAAWLSFWLSRRIRQGKHKRCHVVAYIGGGILLRVLHKQGTRWPIGRSVWDRGPLQERVAGMLVDRVPGIALTIVGLRSIVDLAKLDSSSLTFPQSALGSGLIVETRASALAQRLGIEEDLPAISPQEISRLLPDASSSVALPISHDEVYHDTRFLGAAAAFLSTGRFESSSAGSA